MSVRSCLFASLAGATLLLAGLLPQGSAQESRPSCTRPAPASPSPALTRPGQEPEVVVEVHVVKLAGPLLAPLAGQLGIVREGRPACPTQPGTSAVPCPHAGGPTAPCLNEGEIQRLLQTVSSSAHTGMILVWITPRIVPDGEEVIRQVLGRAPASPERSGPSAGPSSRCEAADQDPARKLYRRAEHYRRQGKTELAGRSYEKVQQFYPASPYARLAARRLDRLHAHEPPRVVEGASPEQGTRPAYLPPPGRERTVAVLVAKYQQACAEGRLAEARKLAAQALRLDPACFHPDGSSGRDEPIPLPHARELKAVPALPPAEPPN